MNKKNVIQFPQKNVRREPRMDGWENLATGLGTSTDKRMYSELRWDLHPPEFYEQMYAGGGIPARIVDLIPDDCMRHWVKWKDVDKKTLKIINERCQAFDLRGNLLKSWKWGRGYGGACAHIVTNTDNPASPLRKGEKILGIRDLSRWDLRILTTDIEYDFGSPNWGHPRLYYLNVQMGSAYKSYPIHWTRMERFDGQLVPRRTFIRNNYWHDSVLNRLYNSIRNYETSHDAMAACLQDFNVDVFKMKGLAKLMGAGQEDMVKRRVEMIMFVKSVLNCMIIDADLEDYENKGRTMEGVAELLVLAMNRLVAETDIPHTKLLGESPDGSNATGNSTDQSYYNYLGSEQQNYLKPKLDRMVNVMFSDMPGLEYEFNALRVMDDKEKAELRKTQSDTDKTYVDMGALDPSEVRESRWGTGEWNMETQLDQEAWEAGEIGPGSNEADETLGQEPGERTEPPGELTGKKKAQGDESTPAKKNDSVGVEGQGLGEANEPKGSEFEPRNVVINMNGSEPKIENFISQTMSEPLRDPKTDPPMKGPGIPNKARVILPTRGNGMLAPSGYDMEKDKNPDANQTEGVQIDVRTKTDAEPEQTRAACIIVRKGDQFLMGKRRDTGRWTLPGGIVERGESMHQGGVRELAEETGLAASKLKFLGSRLVEHQQGRVVAVSIYQHNHKTDDEPTGKNDPDKEVSKWRWVPVAGPLPEDIAGNLQHPNNVALVHLGLLE